MKMRAATILTVAALYAYGFQEGKDGRAWHKVPPGMQPATASAR